MVRWLGNSKGYFRLSPPSPPLIPPQTLLTELSSGPLVALEVSGPEAVRRVREVVGPRDVEMARRLRPSSLRARYGDGPGRPGFHATDLACDGPLECEAMFSPPPAAATVSAARVGGAVVVTGAW